MSLSIPDTYLIGINITGFILFVVNNWLYTHTSEGQIDILLTVATLLGGAVGVLLAILLLDRRPVKDTMMSRVFVLSLAVIQIVAILFSSGVHGEAITLAFWQFFEQRQWLLFYLIIVNIVTIIAFGIDKINAIQRKSRIRIVTLLGLSFAGGSIGAIVAMYAFRHKTKKDYFYIGLPLILLAQIALLLYFVNL